MTILYINTGSGANAGDGDTLRTAFNKVNANFTYLSTASFSGGGGGSGAPGPSGPRGPQGPQGSLGPQGPQGPGADQRLNTTSSVTFTNITITNTATIPSLRATTATVRTLNATTVTSADGFFFNLTADGRTDLAYLTVGTNARVNGVLTAPSSVIAKLTGTNAIITTVTATNLTASAIRSTVTTATNLFATIGSVSTLTVVNKAYISNIDVTSTATFTGNAVFANTASFHSILPTADAAYNLGSPTLRWKNLYVSTSTIYLAGDVVTVAAGKLTVNGNPVLDTATNTVLGGIKIGHNLSATPGGTLTSYQSVVNSAPPYSAQESDQWFDAVGGKQYVFYQGYWVETNLTGVGEPGARGPSGPRGPKGNTGDQGVSVTLVGSTATSAGLPLTGNAGDGWIVNDTGNLWFWSTANSQWEDIGQIVGPQGDAGDPGPEGPSGPSGPSGARGYQGISGPSGAPSTVPGPTGPSGAQGDPGVNADFNYLDAFQIGSTYAKSDIVTYDGASYVAKGTVLPNIGSPDTNPTGWQLVTARGPQGPQGIEGPQGPQGNIGPSGPSGAQGNAGPSGVEGPSGPSGAQGERGEAGGNANTANFAFTASQLSVTTNDDITLVTNANTWTFAADGTLILPSGYSIGGGNGNDGIKLTTDRGTVLFGNTPECVPTQASHFHIMRDDPTTVDLFFGDDYNYVKLPYYSTVTNIDYGVEVGTNGDDGANIWRFGTDGVLTLAGVPNPNFFGDLGTIKYQPSGWFPLQTVGTTINGTVGGTSVAAAFKFNKTLYEFDFSYIKVGVDNIMLDYADVGYPDPPGTKGYPAVITVSIQDPDNPDLWIIGQNNAGVALAEGTTVWLKYNDEYIVLNDAWGFASSTLSMPGNAKLNVNGIDWTFGSDGVLTAPGHILPDANLSYDLGSTSSQWRSIYVGTGTVYIGGVAIGVNRENYVTVNGNPIITINTAGNLTIQGDVNIGTVTVSDTAPTATTGTQWYNSLDGRTYIAYNSQWVDASPAVVPRPETYLGDITIDGSTININDSTLTISNTGTLLVNGQEVTGSGGSGPTIYGASLIASDTDPGTSTGTLWFNTVEGRTFLKYNNQWVDVNPTVVPPPETYLGSITVDDSTININGSTLTVNTSGTLLVNGSEVTGSGGATDRLTTGSHSIILDSAGALNLTNHGVIRNFDNIQRTNIVSGGDFVQLQWTTPQGAAEADPNATNELLNWVFVESGGIYLETNVNGDGDDHSWHFGNDGVLTLPNGGTIFDSGPGGGWLAIAPANAGIGQALVLYPTQQDGNHIHLTANGNNTDLYLGTDEQYVKVDHSGTVVVGTYSTATSTSTWTFGTDGVLTLPGGTRYDAGEVRTPTNDYYLIRTHNTSTGNKDWVFYPDGSTGFPNNTILGTSEDPNVYIETATTSTTSTWTFGTDGVLTLPADTPVIKGGGTGTDVTIIATTGTNTATWTFSASGTVTLPGPINNIRAGTATITGSGDPAYPTALDLTKTVNKLADNQGSTYTLADGYEGQIMYLVPQTGATMTGVNVTVNHARIIDNSTSTALVVTNASLAPFNYTATPVPTIGVTTLIFTDGAWQADAGFWDY